MLPGLRSRDLFEVLLEALDAAVAAAVDQALGEHDPAPQAAVVERMGYSEALGGSRMPQVASNPIGAGLLSA